MKQLETFLKLIIIGILTALVRAYGQGFIPIIEEPLFWPSIFVDGGIQFLGFLVFGSVFYTAIAALFLLMDKNMKGGKLFKGLKFSLFLIVIWTAYSLEPLPHVTVTDMIAYPLVDGAALLILGILSGLLLGTKKKSTIEGDAEGQSDVSEEENVKTNELGSIVDNILSLEEEEMEGQSVELKQAVTMTQDNEEAEEAIEKIVEENEVEIGRKKDVKRSKRKFSPLNVIIIGLIFFLVRIAMYKYFSIYSYFGTHAVETLIWALLTGLAIGVVYEITTGYICRKTWYLRFLIFGAVFLSVILIGFNGFMPLIYRRDVVDLALRTIGDVAAVILAGGICLLFDFKRNISKPANL